MKSSNAKRRLIRLVLAAGLVLAGPAPARPTPPAAPSAAPFAPGETLTYEIKWDPPGWMIFLPGTYTAGFLTLRMEEYLNHQGASAYRLTGDAHSSGALPRLARITVQDHFESWVDANGHCLNRSVKQLREGKRQRDVEVNIHRDNRTAQVREVNQAVQPPRETKNKTLSNTPPCVQDLLAALYTVRMNRFAVHDTYDLHLIDEDQIKTIQIKVQRKEPVKLDTGEVPAVKVQTVSLFGGLFKSGGEMYVWVSDDERKIPLKFDARVKYGHVFGHLKSQPAPGAASRGH